MTEIRIKKSKMGQPVGGEKRFVARRRRKNNGEMYGTRRVDNVVLTAPYSLNKKSS